MDQALAMGVSRRKVYRLVEQKIWEKLHSGVFLTTPDIEGEAAWKAKLAGQVLSGGDGAMVSHRSAALLHRLEGILGRPEESTIQLNARTRPAGSHRTRTIDPHPTTIGGLLTTSLVRTLIDLADVCEVNQLEQALQSALRGTDPRRPDLWSQELLRALRNLAMDTVNGQEVSVCKRCLIGGLIRIVLQEASRSRSCFKNYGRSVFLQFPNLRCELLIATAQLLTRSSPTLAS